MLVGFLDHGVLETLALIGAVAKNSELTDAEKVQRICALLADNQVTHSLDPEQLAELKATLVTELSEEDYYLILSSKSVRMQNRVSPILKAVRFLAEPNAKDLLHAMEHFRLKDGAIDKTAPVDFLTPDERAAVSRDGRFSVSLYKALLFLQVQSAIKSGTLNLEYSYKYRPLDAYLIDRERWQRDKRLLIERADLQAFLDPHQVLAELDTVLYRQYLTTNAHILDGENPHIKFKKRGFSVSTPMLEESDAEALQHYFTRARFRPADGGPCHRQSSYRLDGGISALAAAPSSRQAGRSGRVCRRHRHRLYHRDSQDGAHFTPYQRIGVGEYRQLVLLAR